MISKILFHKYLVHHVMRLKRLGKNRFSCLSVHVADEFYGNIGFPTRFDPPGTIGPYFRVYSSVDSMAEYRLTLPIKYSAVLDLMESIKL